MNITEPPVAASERQTLVAFLQSQRDILRWKIDGLNDEQLRRRMTPSGASLLGMIKHIVYVESWWFRVTFAGLEARSDLPFNDDDPSMDWRIEEGEKTQDILEKWRDVAAESDRIIDAAELDQLSVVKSPRRGYMSLRWVMLHMLEELSRHLGHADMMREAIDGRVGDRSNGTPVIAP